ncbi:MAG: DNA polymerase III subunit delta [Parvularculales bacterium]
MKLNRSDMQRFLKSPCAGVRLALVYGPDRGLAHDRASHLVRAVAGNVDDPFQVATLTEGDLEKDPARLVDEALSLSMTGGRRVVWVRHGGRRTAEQVAALLKRPVSESDESAFVVVEAGDLAPSSGLRKAAEKAGDAVVLPCYNDDSQTLGQLVRGILKEHSLVIEPEALDYLITHLGSDRGVTRREVEKLVLYMGGGSGEGAEEAWVSLEDAQTVVGDTSVWRLDAIADATAEGNAAALGPSLDRAFMAGTNPVAVLASVSEHLRRLHYIAVRAEKGTPPAVTIKSLRPPVHFTRAPSVARQMGRWSRARLDRALALITQADADCRRTGTPTQALCGQVLVTIANFALAAQKRG